jgi:hypothetical protein
MRSRGYRYMGGVNTVWRQQQTRDVKIRSREADLAAELIAVNDLAGDGIRTPEHLAGRVEIAGTNGFANARAAHRLAVEGNSGNPVDGKPQFFAKSSQQSDVATAPVAEYEIRPDTNPLDVAEVTRD